MTIQNTRGEEGAEHRQAGTPDRSGAAVDHNPQIEALSALIFFRTVPKDINSHPPLLSSLQSLESSFLLIGLRRFPHALATCANAWESAMKAGLRVPPQEWPDLDDLVRRARERSGRLRLFSREKLDAFRRTRNRIVHYGFSPKDDAECAERLLGIGIPFLADCYREYFGFCLDWRDIRPGVTDFHALTNDEVDQAGLALEVAEQLRVAKQVYLKARELRQINPTYCFRAFEHYIAVSLKESFRTPHEEAVLEEGESCGHTFGLVEEEKARIDRQFHGVTWAFKCPVCRDLDTLIAELDEDGLGDARISLRRAKCAKCGLAIPESCPYLADVLLAEQVTTKTKEILREFGIKG